MGVNAVEPEACSSEESSLSVVDWHVRGDTCGRTHANQHVEEDFCEVCA